MNKKKNINKKLGLPYGKMRKIVIAFDVDGTLLDNTKGDIVANENIRTLLIILSRFKNTKIIVWSGGGELWARQVVSKLNLNQYVDEAWSKMDYEEIKPDIAIDDIQDTAIGWFNLIVKEK
jgi:hydroxymethylpyrimidine pyrophosphatase-like HAD family hydrolase